MLDIKQTAERIFILPVAKHLRLNPNFVTFLSVVAMLFAFLFVLRHDVYTAALFVFVSGYLDLLDGTIAKYHRITTRFGTFLDRIADRINDILIISAIIVAGLVEANLGIFVLIFVLLSSYTSAVLESQTSTKIGEKLSLRGIRLIIIILGLASNYVSYAFYILAIISVLAFLERFNTAKVVLR